MKEWGLFFFGKFWLIAKCNNGVYIMYLCDIIIRYKYIYKETYE